ncbi:DUF3302 domain-containing protein [Cerasicoccus frondis]|uniref:DUF3302 domain-containing protein n=1 Tax=Cerasicoccus frondis TaxID=490090 RepID=UPI0028524C94|nr:DUF3302 domain-containing protein [Cerasicoccus frondis]
MDKLDIISLGLIFFAVIVIVLGIVKIHCYPGKVAEERGHPQAKAIEVTSLLGLIAFPLWMFALMWAYSNAVIGKIYREEPVKEEKPPKPLPEFLEKHRKHHKEADQAKVESTKAPKESK